MPNPEQRPAATPVWVAHGVVLFVACNTCGWVLSWFGGVTPMGLALTLPQLWVALVLALGLERPPLPGSGSLRRWLQRPSLGLRWVWLAVASCALLGGLLHAPNNMDAMNYRLPKVAWWLMAERWEWIPANNHSLNTRSSGMEWVYVPWIAWLRSDRWLFLLNFLPFLALPGLVFSLLRHAGAARRTCQAWMWILPCGYGYALQAGGIGNDLPAAFFAMAAFDFGWRWKRGGDTRHALLALAAAACMTAVKPTTLPLGLPFLLLFFGMVRPLAARPLRTAALAFPIALASFLPTAALNHHHCGDWTGAKAENAMLGEVDPVIGLVGNLINAPLQNLVSPVFPFAEAWNSQVTTWFPPRFLDAMAANFEARAARFGLTDIQGEESAGLGLGICGLVLVSLAACIVKRSGRPSRQAAVLLLLFGVALLVYFSRAGMTTVARHILPYYAFLIVPLVMAPGIARLTRRTSWNALAMLAGMSSLAMLWITPSRPILPLADAFEALYRASPSPGRARLAAGYRIYADRADVLGPLRDTLPPDARFIGLINHATGPESPLWKPYLQRKVRHLLPNESPAAFRREGMRHVIVNTRDFEKFRGLTPETWLAQSGGTIIRRMDLRPLVKEPPSEWWVVQWGE